MKSEIHETNELLAALNEVRLGKKNLSDVFGTKSKAVNAKLVDATAPYSTESALPDFTKFNERAYIAYSEMMAPKADNELLAIGENLKNSMQTYAAEAEKKSLVIAAGTSATSEGTLADYEYRGIYTMDRGKQIRLFDYTNELSGDERAIPVNRLGNSALEFIYKNGDGLYLKTKLGNSESRPATDSVPTYSEEDITDIPDSGAPQPTAPNNFIERFTTSGEINFGFKPANKNTDSLFRLEFYDYIDRFDRLMKGESFDSITPPTRISYVDLVPELGNDAVTNANTTGLVYQKPYATYAG